MKSGKTILAHTLICSLLCRWKSSQWQLIESSQRSRQSSDLIDLKLLWTEFRSESHGTLTPWISDDNDNDEDVAVVVGDNDDNYYNYYYYRHLAWLDTVKMALYTPINCNCRLLCYSNIPYFVTSCWLKTSNFLFNYLSICLAYN